MRAVLVVALVALASAPAVADNKPVPKYEGKPLEYWVERFQKAETPELRQAAAEAIKAFGADAASALPTFIEMLADHSPGYRRQVIEIVAAIGPKARDARPVIVKLVQDKKTSLYDGSIEAIVATSSDPRDTVSVLIPLLEVEGVNFEAYKALCKIGPDARDALPAVRRYMLSELAVKEKDNEHRLHAGDGLSKFGADAVPLLVEMLDAHGGCGREEALTCLEELGSKAINATPALLKLLKHEDADSRYRAAVMLWKLEKNPAVVAALATLLKTEAVPDMRAPSTNLKSNLAADAAKLLGKIGPDAKEALPALREAVVFGLPASVISSVYFDLGTQEAGKGYFVVTRPKEYELALRLLALAVAAQAASEAIDKIEQKPKK